jgi:hypothetical protein
MDNIEPVFGFVRLFDGDPEPGDELSAGSRPAGGAIV